ncbi:MAG: MFS transporter [Candidatus Omnitrophota bacterium]
METRVRDNKKLTIFSWALYDFANAIFAMNVIALYFVLWVTVEMGGKDIVYSLTLGGSMFLAAISMPILGALSDKGARRLPYLIFFTILCVVFLAFIGATNSLKLGLGLFAVANFGYLISGAVFYNALLPDVADDQKIGAISGYGICLSYIGTITGIFLIRPVALKFGYQATFIPTALLFLLFALPCFLFVKEKAAPSKRAGIGQLVSESMRDLFSTLEDIKRSKELSSFFLGIFVVINAVNAVFIFMSVYLKKVFLFSDGDIMKLYIYSNIFSVIGALLSGAATDRLGAKRTLMAAAAVCSVAVFAGVVTPTKLVFWIAGPMVGLAFSSIRVSGRALAVELFPKEKIGQIFGHLGLLSNLAFLGLIAWGVCVYLFEPLGDFKYRVALFTLLMILLLGINILRKGGLNVKRKN